jgi:tetratricopeptide (TPR) repeat protein
VVAACATGYRQETDRIERELAAIEAPSDTEQLTRYVSFLYQRASLAGDLPALADVEREIDRAIARLPNPGDLYLLKANLAFKLHRLDDVQAALAAHPHAFESPEGQALRADLDFQRGRYEAAREGYEEILRSGERRWDNLARLAHFKAKMEGDAAADRLYEEAEDELTAKEMRAYAWLEVQRGFLDFTRGRYAGAREHYRRAESAYPDYWFVADYAAELLGAEGRYAEAVAIYERLVATAPKPEFHQALGELYELMGDTERAQQSGARALAQYLESARRGEVHYYHHLVDYYSDVAMDGANAVDWARRDLALRENFGTQSALAWAFYRDGQFAEAREWIRRALDSGAVEARLYHQAARIHEAAGAASEANRYNRRAIELNPQVDGFHVHH